MNNTTKKRASLYFNLDDPEDKLIWDHLEKRKKSQYIKRLILNDINGVNVISGLAIQSQAHSPAPNVEQDKDETSVTEERDDIVKTDIDEDLGDFPEGID